MGRLAVWWHKVSHFEYWPFDIFYIPIYFYFGWLALKHRSFFFFTSANPFIDFGGMLGEKKSAIYELIPDQWVPKTILFQPKASSKEILDALDEANLSFPVIFKPNIGERGWMVEKIDNLAALHRYLSNIKVDFLVQEYVNEPLELGLFYVRFPNEPSGRITSLTMKGFLSVTGDGRNTVDELLKENKRALLSFDFEHPEYRDIKESIPKEDEIVVVETIGNHCRGTSFLDMTDKVTREMEEQINQVMKEVKGFYFGRLDLRCRSLETLAKGEDWKILELNGAGAEPGHVYQPGFGIWNAYRDIIAHLNMLSKVSKINKNQGHKYWSFRRGIAKMQEIRAYNKRYH